jgi:putative transposase
VNRAVRRARLFDHASDYRAFTKVMAEAQSRVPLRLLSYCVMPNHFHLVAWPSSDEELSDFMHWFTGTHSKRWHAYRGTSGTGSVYQGPFKAFPVQTDRHFLTVCRYVEQNPLRARLVERAQDWVWSSLYDRCRNCRPVELAEWPILQPADWIDQVNRLDTVVVTRIRRSIIRNSPFGDVEWAKRTARQVGLEASLRPLGRPKKTPGVVLQKA